MDTYLTPISTIVYIESHIREEIDCAKLARQVGFSLAHLREVFANTMGMPLQRYILSRRIANAAAALIHTRNSIADIAVTFGFSSHDAFARAFRRVAGVTPSAFREAGVPVARVKLCAGVYGPGLPREAEVSSPALYESHEEGSTLLYGVPRVGYGTYDGCTPYPICLKACANYLGDTLSYEEIMTTSAIGFRLTWDTTCWNPGNVDNCFTFDDGKRSYTTGLQALGREYEVLWRGPETKKEEFVAFIVQQISAGYPVIARGIIGPPEACIITGYRDNGQTLLGWNFFQDNPEFRGHVAIDPSGYFVTSEWWERADSWALFCVRGVSRDGKLPLETVMKNAKEVLTGRMCGNYAKGVLAYDAWKKALADPAAFPPTAILPLLAERMMCYGDAMDCLTDGRHNVWKYLNGLGKSKHPRAAECAQLAACLFEGVRLYQPMLELVGGWQRGEEQMRKLAGPQVRVQLCGYIDRLKAVDEKFLDLIEKMI